MALAGADIDALCFDVFGTVVDWRSSVIVEGQKLGAARGLDVDWCAFADAWRRGYRPAMDRVRSGELPWTRFDALQRLRLDELIEDFGITALSEADKADYNEVWQRLAPWSDSVPGLSRLAQRYVIAPLSNGSVAALTRMAKRAGLPWDCVLSAELCQHYKPDRNVYDMAAALLAVAPARIVMAAAHPYDLQAAASYGFRTAFIRRPLEFGSQAAPEPDPDFAVDLVVDDIEALADRLDA